MEVGCNDERSILCGKSRVRRSRCSLISWISNARTDAVRGIGCELRRGVYHPTFFVANGGGDPSAGLYTSLRTRIYSQLRRGYLMVDVRRFVVRIACEPILHFALLGAAMYVGGTYLEERSIRTRIMITQSWVRQAAENYRLQYGRSPSPQQTTALVENYIKQEILYREAINLGLDVNDEIVRRRMVQKYEFLYQDHAAPAEPTEAELIDYYQEHLAQYRRPQSVTFTHVYFSPDRRGEDGAYKAAQEAASTLTRRARRRGVEYGDRFPGNYDLIAVEPADLARAFGKEGLAEAIFDVEMKRWSVPLRSGFGWHTVYVSGRREGRQAEFEEVHEVVRRDRMEDERDRANAETFAKLRQRYQIIQE